MSGFYPHNPNLGQLQQTDTPGVNVAACFVSKLVIAAAAAVAASATGIHAAVTDNGSDQTVTTGITNPATPRNITATAGGTSGDVKAIQVVITGTNYADEVITETLPAFTVNTTGIVQGNKAFKTVTSILIPAHDGTGATTAIGWGDKLGLPDKLPTNTVLLASLGGTKEATAPTVTASASALESNTVDLNSALDGSEVAIYYLV
jgi:hypothetical protein